MGIAVVWLRGGNWPALDMAMEQRGFVRHVKGDKATHKLPRGVYWRAEQTEAEELLGRAKAAVTEAGEPTARIVTTEGASAWAGLDPIDGG